MRANSLSVDAKVVETRQIAEEIRLIRFAVQRGALQLEAGAHITFDIPQQNGVISRCYSVVDDGQTQGLVTIAVRRERMSKGGSKYMHALQVGDSIVISSCGNLMRPAFSGEAYVVLAGGIGITPMTGIVRALMRTGKPVRMIYCARSAQDAAFVPEMQALLGDRLQTCFDNIGQTLDIPKLVASLSRDTIVFMCGPQGLMNAVKAAWRLAGLPIENLRYETFASSGSSPNAAFTVTVSETGRTIEVAENESLLDALLSSGHQILSDCRRGECGLCKINVTQLEGHLDHRDVFLSDLERADRNCICACVSRLASGSMNVSIDGIQHGRASRATRI